MKEMGIGNEILNLWAPTSQNTKLETSIKQNCMLT